MILPNRLREFLLPVDRAHRVGRLLVICAVVGVVAGLGAIFFEVLVDLAKYYLLDGIAGYRPPGPGAEGRVTPHTDTLFRPWVLALLPAIGGLVSGSLVYWLAPEAEGHGTDGAIDAYHNKRGFIRTRVPFVKALASAITLGTGGSAGREGPIAHIGAGLASGLATVLRLSTRERRLLMAAGLAAGIGAIFRAPLAGALFAAEVLYLEMDLEFEVLVPAVIASIVAFSVFTIPFGAAPLFSTPSFVFRSPLELIPYLALTLMIAGGAKVHVKIFDYVHSRFKSLKIPRPLKPAVGGLVVGAFAFFLPEAMGSGYGIVQHAFTGQVTLGILAAVALGKMVTTAFTVGSGGSGGIFGPAIVVGGAIGGFVGGLAEIYMPQLSPSQGAFVIVGMAGFFAAAAHTPVSTIIMVSEMTGSYELLVPTMWVCIIGSLLVRRSTLYESQLPRRSDSPVHLGEMMGEVLERLTVRDALRSPEVEPMISVPASTGLEELLRRFSESHHAVFAIVDDEGRLLGVVNDQTLRQAIGTEALLTEFVVAADLVERAPTLRFGETLHSAMRKMVSSRHDELVVVDEHDERKPMGTLSRRDLISTYDKYIQLDRRERTDDTAWPGMLRRFKDTAKPADEL